ncbi:MAG: hypothetical protein WC815_05665 [Vicinamibacterales bacterium]|jgi:hypothetical protein
MPVVLVLFLLCATGAEAQSNSDDLTRTVAVYELTMPRIEGYGAVMAGIADWAGKDPKAVAAMMGRAPKGPMSVQDSAAIFEKEPAVKLLLDKHKVTGLDMVVLPMAVMQAQVAALGESQGRTFPADRINPKNIALAKANGAAIDAVMKKAQADRVRAFPQPQ